MKTSTRLTLSSIFVALLLVACDSGLSASLPQDSTATPAPLTSTPAPALPTETPAPPTDAPALSTTLPPTVVEGTGEAEGDTPLGAALMKFGAAKAYRAEMEMKGEGALGLSTDENNPNSPETSLFVLTGDFAGSDGHYMLKGFLSSLLGVDPDAGVEAILLGGKPYVHGPVSLLGADQAKWYVLESDQGDFITPPFAVSDYLGALGNSDVQLGSFTPAGDATVDGKKCHVLSADKTEAAKAMAALNSGALPGLADLTNVDAATAKFTLCDDGYIHRIALTLDASEKDKPETKASFTVNIHVYDFNAAIAITAPKDPIPLKSVDIMPPTDTPTK